MDTVLAVLKPTEAHTIIELVEQSGFDVSDWANYKGKHPSANPKYCYEWVFQENNHIVITVWWDELFTENGIQVINNYQPHGYSDPTRATRARKMDEALRFSYSHDLPLTAIIRSKTNKSLKWLDSEKWRVSSYNTITGDVVISRGSSVAKDQFDIDEQRSNTYEVNGVVYQRQRAVRQQAMLRANGKCEYCGEETFKTLTGFIYLESHHIHPLSEGGTDTLDNVIALCPLHHREVHYGQNKDELSTIMRNLIA